MEYRELGRTGVRIPVLGLGTFGTGFGSGGSVSEGVAALRRGLDLGLTLIDTAEMYGGGRSEEVVGEAVKGRRDGVFIATKVSPGNLSYDGVLRSAEKSLRRLGTSWIDLYQIHAPNPWIPVGETMRAMGRLVEEGRVRFVGVSNFSVEETRAAQAAFSGGLLASNQVEYSLLDRSIEGDLLPFCQRERITVIAYTPLGHGRILYGEVGRRLAEVGVRCGRTPVQVALNWLVSKEGVVAIPKAARVEHVEEIAGAVGWRLAEEADASSVADLGEL